MHDLLFSDQKQMTRSSLVARAKSLSVDTKAFEACLADDTVARQIQDDEAFARTLNITGTPALLVGKSLEDGRVEFVAALRGAVPFDELQKKIDAALNTRRLSPLWLAGGGLVIVAFLGGRMYQRARKRSSSEPIQ
jgi:protein-disulfide isomerase